MKLRNSLPAQLLLIAIGVLLFGNYLPLSCIKLFYTFSLAFKELLAFIVPLMVFVFIVSAIFSFQKKTVPLVLGLILGALVFSNVCASFISLLFSIALLWLFPQLGSSSLSVNTTTDILQPYFSLHMPVLFSTQWAMIVALLVGCLFSFYKIVAVERIFFQCKSYLEKFLVHIFIPFVPLYVFGFMLQLQYEGSFVTLFTSYGKIFAAILGIQFLYLFFLYYVGSGFSFASCIRAIKNALPSYFTAFSTMSSVATIPVTLETSKKNVQNASLVNLSVPIMANFHLAGDAVTVPSFAVMTLVIFTGGLPPMTLLSWFIVYFCMAMFAISGVPGGGIIVILPLLRSLLGFNDSMEGIIHTLYLLQDSFGTAANVMGDGGLIMIIEKILNKFQRKL